MSEPKLPEQTIPGVSREEMQSALFAQLVMQQASMASMLMGATPHPETGQAMKDLEAARIFIDQLEMLEGKTKGNLSKEEASLLKQSLMGLRLAYVQAVEAPAAPKAPEKPAEAAPAAEEESRKKFSKKYLSGRERRRRDKKSPAVERRAGRKEQDRFTCRP